MLDIVSMSLRSFKQDGNRYGELSDKDMNEDENNVEEDIEFETRFLEQAVLKMAKLLTMVILQGKPKI